MTLKERVDIVVNMCNREIERQEGFMRCAEHHDNDHQWLRHYDLQGVYMTIRDILSGTYHIIEDEDNWLGE